MKYVLPNTLKHLEHYRERQIKALYAAVEETDESKLKEKWDAFDKATEEYKNFYNRYRIHIERSLENEEVIR